MSDSNLDKILRRLDEIERKIDRLEMREVARNKPPVTIPPMPSIPKLGGSVTCSVCGMVWEGVMSYSCMNSNCPVQLQTTSLSNTTGQFEIESLDPAERSWYYDGDGTKRKKT